MSWRLAFDLLGDGTFWTIVAFALVPLLVLLRAVAFYKKWFDPEYLEPGHGMTGAVVPCPECGEDVLDHDVGCDACGALFE